MSLSAPLLSVRDLVVRHARERCWLGAPSARTMVDHVSFDIFPGNSLALVGESGCGKTTLARTVLRLTPASCGEVRFAGRDVLRMAGPELAAYRRSVQMVFQDPAGSLNPRLRVADLVTEPLLIHGLVPRRERRRTTLRLLEQVGLGTAHADRYPHELSGGQRQRVGIARALAPVPRLLICDEPTSALDVSVQAEVLNLLADLRAGLGLTCLFITHNLAVVRTICDAVAVMHEGKIVETGSTSRIFTDPRHACTRALLDAVPAPDPPSRASSPAA
ncbi:MAG: ABC transporter ATP-binding protein [Phycisphaerales bacterium]|nr:ABC transporter ATP-binding protein [Phycisphaerales bacterium]